MSPKIGARNATKSGVFQGCFLRANAYDIPMTNATPPPKTKSQ